MRILAIASKGGHWIQLLRLMPAINEHEIIYVSTNMGLSKTVNGHKFYCVPDGDRGRFVKLAYTLVLMLKIVSFVRPKVIITTGSAPGLMAIIAGKILGTKTIWIDSIANVERISASGKIALHFADQVYTQWIHLANSRIKFSGNVLS
jgi:UDP-N-acetylglucosamine:LPS N-acetylglucosamine transferase